MECPSIEWHTTVHVLVVAAIRTSFFYFTIFLVVALHGLFRWSRTRDACLPSAEYEQTTRWEMDRRQADFFVVFALCDVSVTRMCFKVSAQNACERSDMRKTNCKSNRNAHGLARIVTSLHRGNGNYGDYTDSDSV